MRLRTLSILSLSGQTSDKLYTEINPLTVAGVEQNRIHNVPLGLFSGTVRMLSESVTVRSMFSPKKGMISGEVTIWIHPG